MTERLLGPRAWRLILRGLLAVLVLVGFCTPAQAADDFLPPEQAFVASAAMVDPLTLDIHYAIAPDYYMYQERFEVTLEDAQGQLLLFHRSALTPPEMETRTPQWADALQLPGGQVTWDPTFEQDMVVYHDGATLRIPLQPGADAPLQVTVTGQGCSDQGLCYPPMTQTFSLVAAGDGYVAQGSLVRDQVPAPRATASVPDPTAAGDTAGATDAAPGSAAPMAAGPPERLGDWGDMGMAAWLHQAPLWQILLLSLAFGALLSFTPCVLPMVPILLALLSGSQATARCGAAAGGAGRGTAESGSARGPGRARGLWLAAVYVFGMSLVYTALGVAAGLLGAGLAAWLQNPWVLGSFAVLLALFALAMLDVFTLQAPTGLQTALQTRLQRLPGGQTGAVLIMGAVSALIVGPCVAAPLAGVLLFISQTGDWLVGGAALFAMAWGQGLLLLVVGAGAGVLLPRAGAWMDPLKHAFGILLLATAWWMARPLLGASLYVGGWVVLAVWAGLLLWAASSPAATGEAASRPAAGAAVSPWRHFWRGLALLVMLWGLAQGAGLLAGGRDMLRPLAPFAAAGAGASGIGGGGLASGTVDVATIRARFTPVASVADLDEQLATTDRPVMLDFYADWCVSCLEMEKFTFSDARVAARMGDFLLLQADVTRMTADDKALLARFDLFGPPGILFFDGRGQYRPDARVIGFKNADEFLWVLDGVR
ncbi:protein-disulfide reductase DsbD domain-containing protein [Castellaniella sp.]|uniref:cytochrome c biogenesis protein CcdA n=1 Tax=Castellaniella sp. TaxID=1955812 RepID=UPI0035609922